MTGDHVAIVGMACRVPGANSIEEFWHNVEAGVETVATIDDDRLIAAGVDAVTLADPRYVRRGGILTDLDRFDADYFGYGPREAELLDPQHRLFLECATEALQRAGYDSPHYDGLVGVYGSVGFSSYLLNNVASNRHLLDNVPDLQVMISGDKDYLASRVSYKLNLHGPAMTVQTACSSSLVAVHLAAQALLAGECDLALAGGASIHAYGVGYLAPVGGILAADGHCRAFDAEATGVVPGSGAGVVALKRLADAEDDGDVIHAVIRGSAVNNDGAHKVGYSAPSRRAQREVIEMALGAAEVDPETVGFVEAHGAATRLGDSIEMAALNDVFGRTPGHRCALGSTKAAIGHLDTAAGAVGLIKTALAVQHSVVPATVNFRSPNPEIDFAAGPFFVPAERQSWQVGDGPRRAGVSSFGMGGTNAHVVLEQATTPASPSSDTDRPTLLKLSARSTAALDQMAHMLADHLESHPEVALTDAAWTLHMGRPELPLRRAMVVGDRAEAIRLLRDPASAAVHDGTTAKTKPSVVFLLSGVGDQFEGMAAGLYRERPAFRDAFDQCAKLFEPLIGFDLRQMMVPCEGEAPRPSTRIIDDEPSVGNPALRQTVITQPLMFTIGYSLGQTLFECGVKPSALLGYSIGEYAAACLAGVFDLPDTVRLVAARAKLIESVPPGRLLAVLLDEESVRGYLTEPGVSLSAIDGPKLCVLGGTVAGVEAVAARLRADGIAHRMLPGEHAFHTDMMRALDPALTELASGIELRPPRIPLLSNVTGRWLTDDEARDPGYWARHTYRPVQFADCLEQVWSLSLPVVVELGPGRGLGTLAVQHPRRASVEAATTLHTMPGRLDDSGDEETLLRALGRLWLCGVQPHWAGVAGPARRVILPTYPFQRGRYWLDAVSSPASIESAVVSGGKVARRQDPADWFALPSWRREEPPVPAERSGVWLVLTDNPVGERVAATLVAAGHDVRLVAAGGPLGIDLDSRDDYSRLVELIPEPARVVHCVWDEGPGRRPYYSLQYLAQALWGAVLSPVEIIAVTAHGVSVAGEAELRPLHATVGGLCRVLPQEFPHVSCRTIDVSAPASEAETTRVAAQIGAEAVCSSIEPTVAYRHDARWVQTYERARLETTETSANLRRGGVYLIVGGLGTVGSVIANYLVDTAGAHIGIVRRSAMPPRDQWERLAADPSTSQELAWDLDILLGIQARGSRVLVAQADVADEEAFTRAVAEVERELGPLAGVFHSASVVGQGAELPLDQADDVSTERHFRSKLDGLPVMARVLADKPLDFVVLNSSISSVLGGIGYGAYASANCFMDTFAHRQRRHSQTAWTAINWEGFAYGEDAEEVRTGATLHDLLIDDAQARDVIDRIMCSSLPVQIVVTTGDVEARVDQWARHVSRLSMAAEQQTTAVLHGRPHLHTAYVRPGTEDEKQIATIWQDLLGIAEIGLNDNFFDLGGHSLIATQLAGRIQEEFKVRVTLRAVLSKPTIADLAELIAKSTKNQTSGAIRRVARERYRAQPEWEGESA
ncbi:KR domain-containing protein [Nonomuraea sp. K274]|uniref:KR domain-containing protein n=1 Tax=Nonomuraea cypriaca TaxID=1187855 RepID=A0A931EZ07_9ACTN|nr:type I polyketide synthase [Nonomuraea cypriaca]MBF8187057.1 KR domain-containing protein [Nonomuraea cypriaca]